MTNTKAPSAEGAFFLRFLHVFRHLIQLLRSHFPLKGKAKKPPLQKEGRLCGLQNGETPYLQSAPVDFGDMCGEIDHLFGGNPKRGSDPFLRPKAYSKGYPGAL